MPICIDIHAHFLPDAFVAVLQERGLADPRKDAGTLELAHAVCGYAAPTTRLPYFPLLYDLDTRRELARAQGIDRQIVCLPPFYFAYAMDPGPASALCRAGNEALAATVARAPERFAAFAPLDDQALDVFWAACCELDVPVFMHPHHELGGERAGPYYLGNLFGNPSETGLIAARLIFAGVFERFPQLNMILAHAGGTLAAIAGRLDHGYRVRSETKTIPKLPSAYLAQLYVDTITHDDAYLAYLARKLGTQRIVVGTDRPFDMGIDDPRGLVMRIPGLDDAQRAAILGENARGFLRRSLPPAT